MKKLIAANWKMNPVSRKEAEEIFSAIKTGVAGSSAEVVVCPPSIYLPILSGITVGAQNLFWEEKGAFTGEVSAKMLKDVGAEYVIIGHSERRNLFGETDEAVNNKIKSAISAELEQIFCVGETAEERSSGKAEEVVGRQIKDGLAGLDDVIGMVIAYEPVWAIGTGNACSVEDAGQMKSFIQKVMVELYGENVLNGGVRIIYGGSVNSGNSASYLNDAGYDGLLVGGASLKPAEFTEIVKSAE